MHASGFMITTTTTIKEVLLSWITVDNCRAEFVPPRPEPHRQEGEPTARCWRPLPYTLLLVMFYYIFFFRPISQGHFKRVILYIVALTALVTFLHVNNSSEVEDEEEAFLGLVKVWCELPLGLGSLMLYPLLCNSSSSKRKGDDTSTTTKKYLYPWFTHYVNFAVFGNVLMMAWIPYGSVAGVDESNTKWRWYVGKLCCVCLVWYLWVVAKRHSFKTVFFLDDWWCHTKRQHSSSSAAQQQQPPPLFLWNSSPLSWVLPHTLYRAMMMTYPIFQGTRYLSLELLSLGGMYFYHRRYKHLNHQLKNQQNVRSQESSSTMQDQVAQSQMEHTSPSSPIPCTLQVTHFFGIADTCAVAAAGTFSKLADAVAPFVQQVALFSYSIPAPLPVHYASNVQFTTNIDLLLAGVGVLLCLYVVRCGVKYSTKKK